MSNKLKLAVTSFLLLALLGSVILPVCAADEEEGAKLTISNTEDFLTFAENCLLDTYSSGMTVKLTADIDLSGMEFTGIPIFSGVFDGDHHRISGLRLTGKGSDQGLFRYLTEQACVQNLNVEGAVLPEGSRIAVGGIAGSNAGKILNCTFSGEVSGSDGVGGLAGINQVSGIIEDCQSSGSVHGNHFVGGIAGKNFGLIRSCENRAGINMTAGENDVSISEISSSTIIATESADSVTDVGGIAGTSTGVIRGCENRATVGYQHMGYNIGGIAGSQRGFITECTNHGEIYGRKEIAGIVGQMEPISKIEYTEDTLQILQQQLSDTADLASQASSNVYDNAAELGNQVDSLRSQAETAADAIHQLLPSQEEPHLPDLDTIQAARNTLSSCVSDMQGTISSLQSSARDGVSTASHDIQAITAQINAISGTVGSASENLGGTVTDISDSDTPDDLTGKILDCANHGAISGDLNVGGITGSVAWENDLDPEDDFQFTSGSQSLKFDSQLRAVITQSQNNGRITAKKRNAGGIVGSLSMGLVKACTNVGAVDASDGENIGGIAGSSSGFIRNCSAKCQLSGVLAVGGIAGQGCIVTDCRSLVEIPREGEKLGSVIGICTESSEESPVSGNYYLPVGKNLGAIDGINYDAVAQALSREKFLALEDLPDLFDTAVMTFLFEDGEKKQITVALGTEIDPSQIPAVPEKDGQLASWDQLDGIDLHHVYFDVTLQPEYEPCQQVVASTQQRGNGKPILLAEGQFPSSTGLELEAIETPPVPDSGMTALESWKIPRLSQEKTTYHLALPESLDPASAAVLVQSEEGTWKKAAAVQDGSYLVFSADETDQAFCLVKTDAVERAQLLRIVCVLAGVLLVIILIFVIRHHRKKKKTAK